LADTNNEYLVHLTGLRAVAALMVFVFHIRNEITLLLPSVNWLHDLIHFFDFGVDIFFVLSGFVIYKVHGSEFRNYRDLYNSKHYLLKRLIRLYPIHLVSLLMMVWFISEFPVLKEIQPNRYSELNVIRQVFMIHAWSQKVELTWNFVSWSVSAEWLVYLMFPLIAVLMSRVNSIKSSSLVMFGIMIIYSTFVIIADFRLHYNYGLYRVICEFVLGCFLAKEYCNHQRGVNSKVIRQISWFVIPTLSGLVIGLNKVHLTPQSVVLMPLLSVLIIFYVLNATGRVKHFLSNPWLVYFGTISYAFYLAHGIVLTVTHFFFRHSTASPGEIIWLLFADFTASVVLALIFHYFVDSNSKRILHSIA